MRAADRHAPRAGLAALALAIALPALPASVDDARFVAASARGGQLEATLVGGFIPPPAAGPNQQIRDPWSPAPDVLFASGFEGP